MAEGFAKNKIADQYNIHSAGVEAHGINPIAVKVMSEVGIDISNHHSNSILDSELIQYDTVVTLCGDAKDRCPILSNHNNHIHWGLEDPASATGSDKEVIDFYRKIRDQIKHKINSL